MLEETADYHFQLVARHWARARTGQLSRQWLEASAMTGSGGMVMSPGQLSALNQALLEVVREHSAVAERDPQPGAASVLVLLHSFPLPDSSPPSPSTGPGLVG